MQRIRSLQQSRTYLLALSYVNLIRSIGMIFHIDQVRAEIGAGCGDRARVATDHQKRHIWLHFILRINTLYRKSKG
jgi:hypothetical protein